MSAPISIPVGPPVDSKPSLPGNSATNVGSSDPGEAPFAAMLGTVLGAAALPPKPEPQPTTEPTLELLLDGEWRPEEVVTTPSDDQPKDTNRAIEVRPLELGIDALLALITRREIKIDGQAAAEPTRKPGKEEKAKVESSASTPAGSTDQTISLGCGMAASVASESVWWTDGQSREPAAGSGKGQDRPNDPGVAEKPHGPDNTEVRVIRGAPILELEPLLEQPTPFDRAIEIAGFTFPSEAESHRQEGGNPKPIDGAEDPVFRVQPFPMPGDGVVDRSRRLIEIGHRTDETKRANPGGDLTPPKNGPIESILTPGSNGANGERVGTGMDGSSGGSWGREHRPQSDANAGQKDRADRVEGTDPRRKPTTEPESREQAPVSEPAHSSDGGRTLHPPNAGRDAAPLQRSTEPTSGFRLTEPKPIDGEPSTRRSDHVVVDLKDDSGDHGKLKVSMTGQTVRATILPNDAALADRLALGIRELRQSLEDRGFPEPRVTVQSPKPEAPLPNTVTRDVVVELSRSESGSPTHRDAREDDRRDRPHHDRREQPHREHRHPEPERDHRKEPT